jgi:hypothetical protein
MKDRKRWFAHILNLTTRQRRDEMLERAIKLTHLTQHSLSLHLYDWPVKSASSGMWLKAGLSTVENRPMHSSSDHNS